MKDRKDYPPGHFKGWSPKDVARELGLRAVNDPQEIEDHCGSAMREFPDQVQQYRDGKRGLIGFFISKVMERTRNGAHPEMTRSTLERMLGA